MKYCSVSGCDNNTGKSGISFFSFPKENRLKEEWVKFINRRDWAPKLNSKICSVGHATYATQFLKLRLRGQMIDKNTYI